MGENGKVNTKVNQQWFDSFVFYLISIVVVFDASTEPSESAEGPGGAAGPAGGPPEADGG